MEKKYGGLGRRVRWPLAVIFFAVGIFLAFRLDILDTVSMQGLTFYYTLVLVLLVIFAWIRKDDIEAVRTFESGPMKPLKPPVERPPFIEKKDDLPGKGAGL